MTLAITACGDDEEPDQEFVPPPPGDTTNSWILVDNIHTLFQNPDKMAYRGNYDYDGMHGYHRLFRHLEANNYPYRQIFHTSRGERLTPEILKDFKILFINLITRDRPDFTASEIEAIHDFVREGGGLFIIADHTNVYRHAERVNPILIPMGIEVHYSTASDFGDYARGGYWLIMRHFDRTTPEGAELLEGVDFATWQTGAALVTDHGFTFTSPDGFADFWNLGEEDDPGYYGNGFWDRGECGADGICVPLGSASDGMSCASDDDCEGEPRGSLPTMAATSFGAGRVAVVADQNIFGDEWLFVAQNFELVSNIFEWLAFNEDAQVPLRARLEDRYTVVGFEIEKTLWNIAVGGCEHFFPFFINFNRTENVAGRGIEKYTGAEDVLVFTDPAETFSQEEIGQLEGYLSDGKTIVLLSDITLSRAGARQLMETFIPDVSFSSKASFSLAELPAGDDLVETVVQDEEFVFLSDTLPIDGMRMAGHVYPSGVECPLGIEDAQPYMRQLTVEGGEPLLQAEVGGEVADVAKIFSVNGGRVIVFFQDGFWRNQTLGWELQRPSTSTADAHEIEYAFIDWLIGQTPGGQ